MSGAQTTIFDFRPWVRRAGFSIVAVAAAITAAVVATLVVSPSARYGWIGEHFVWVYVGTLWIGGLKIWLTGFRPIAEVGPETIILRPLHHLGSRTIRWDRVRGTEQTIGGDRLTIYFEGRRGRRFVALNLNLVKRRRELVALIETRLGELGFNEKVVERSRYLVP